MLSDREKKEIADIVLIVLDAKLEELYKQIALGFMEISNIMMEDLASILNAQTSKRIEEIKKQREEYNKSKSKKLGFHP